MSRDTLSRLSRGEMLRCHKTQITQTDTSRARGDYFSLTPTQRLKRGNKAANKRREIYSLFCEFWRCQYLKENICTYFLRKLVIWLHSRLQESDSFFEVMFTTILILRQQNLTKARIKRKISIISNILIVILCSTKEYLEGPKTAAYVNNKIKLSFIGLLMRVSSFLNWALIGLFGIILALIGWDSCSFVSEDRWRWKNP